MLVWGRPKVEGTVPFGVEWSQGRTSELVLRLADDLASLDAQN